MSILSVETGMVIVMSLIAYGPLRREVKEVWAWWKQEQKWKRMRQ